METFDPYVTPLIVMFGSRLIDTVYDSKLLIIKSHPNLCTTFRGFIFPSDIHGKAFRNHLHCRRCAGGRYMR